MSKPSYIKYCIATLGGTFGVSLLALFAGELLFSGIRPLWMIAMIVIIPTSIMVCVLGYPVFKISIKKFDRFNYFFNVFISGFLSSLLPISLTAVVLALGLPSGQGELSDLLDALMFSIVCGAPFIIVASIIYWLLSKRV